EEYELPGEGQPGIRESGTFIFAFDVTVFRSLGAYEAAVERIVTRVKGVRPAPGSGGVLVPGEPELATRAQRLRDGIPIPATTWAAIRRSAADSGITVPEV